MKVQVSLSQVLQKFTNGQADVSIELSELSNITNMIDSLDSGYPGLKERLLDADTDKIRRFINVYVNGEDIRFLEGMNTVLYEGNEIIILPSISGGT